MSSGVERDRARVLSSVRSGLGPPWEPSWVNTGWLDACVGVLGGVGAPEALLLLEKSLMLPVVELDAERKMPPRLRRRGDLGDEHWSDEKGKMDLGDPELGLICTGADRECRAAPAGLLLDAPLMGLVERTRRSPVWEPLLVELLVSDA